jgi:hypothetical protein
MRHIFISNILFTEFYFCYLRKIIFIQVCTQKKWFVESFERGNSSFRFLLFSSLNFCFELGSKPRLSFHRLFYSFWIGFKIKITINLNSILFFRFWIGFKITEKFFFAKMSESVGTCRRREHIRKVTKPLKELFR